MSEVGKKHFDALAEIAQLVADGLGPLRQQHPETMIASAARLSGSLLLRSFNLPMSGIAPGTKVLSDQANEKGPMLVDIVWWMLQRNSISLDRSKLSGENRGEEPKLTALESISLLQDDARKIAERHRFSMEDAAFATALTTAFFVQKGAEFIGVEVSFNVAAYGFVEGSKTAPPDFKDASNQRIA